MTTPVSASPAAEHLTQELSPADQQLADRSHVRLLELAPGSEWDTVALNTPHVHLGTASHWFTIIRSAYGHLPLYFFAQDNAVGPNPLLLPAFLVRRWPLKGVITSMPFLDAGGPAGRSGVPVHTVLKRLLFEAQNRKAAQVELRSRVQLDVSVQPSLEKVTLVRSLPPDPDLMWRDLDSKVRNQIRKAERSGISIEVGGLDRLDEFYRVFAINMRDLGSPVHSRQFFSALVETFGQAAHVVIARKNTLPVGGLIAVDFGDTRYVPWASTLRTYNPLCPNMLMYWETLRRACIDGMARFDFGRSSRGSGTYRFKRQWGAEDAQLYWYTIPVSGGRPTRISPHERKWVVVSRVWGQLPVGLTRLIGPIIRRYLTQ